MKKILLLTLVLFCLTSQNLMAQNDNTAEYRKTLKTFIEISGSSAAFDMIVSQMLTASGIDEAKTSSILNKALDSLVDLFAPVYQKYLQIGDLEAAVKFYQTPEGQRMAKAQPALLQDASSVAQQWVVSLQQIIEEAK